MHFRLGTEPPGTTVEQVWHAQKLYMSAFHPDTGEKMNTIGRMSFQVPGGMLITGCLLQFYKYDFIHISLYIHNLLIRLICTCKLEFSKLELE